MHVLLDRYEAWDVVVGGCCTVYCVMIRDSLLMHDGRLRDRPTRATGEPRRSRDRTT